MQRQTVQTGLMVTSLALALVVSLVYLMWNSPNENPQPVAESDSTIACKDNAQPGCEPLSEAAHAKLPLDVKLPLEKRTSEASADVGGDVDGDANGEVNGNDDADVSGATDEVSGIIVMGEVAGGNQSPPESSTNNPTSTQPTAPAIKTFNHRNPEFSPDGSRIAFECDTAQQTGQICMTSIAGDATLRVLTQSDGRVHTQPQWSPDGKHIAFLCDRDLCVWSESGGVKNMSEATRLDANAWSLHWSANSSFVLFACGEASGSAPFTNAAGESDVDPAGAVTPEYCVANVSVPYALNLSATLKRLGIQTPVLLLDADNNELMMDCLDHPRSECAGSGNALGSPYTLAAALSANTVRSDADEPPDTTLLCALPQRDHFPVCVNAPDDDEANPIQGGGKSMLSDG